MNDLGRWQALVFVLAFIWFAFFSKQTKFMRIWMCACSLLLILWMMS